MHAVTLDKINALGIGRTFQAVEIFENLTVLENAMAGGVAATDIGLTSCLNRWGKARRGHDELVSRAREVLDLVGLSGFAALSGAGLSSRQQRLLRISRVLLS